MNYKQLESFMEKFLFLNFETGYDLETSIKTYIENSDINKLKQDAYYIGKYIRCNELSLRRKEILILQCVKVDFSQINKKPIEWLEQNLLEKIEQEISKK